jgi:hypothetical protein
MLWDDQFREVKAVERGQSWPILGYYPGNWWLSRYSDWLGAARSDVRGSIPGGVRNVSLRHRVQTGSWAHPASYPMGTRVSFSGGKWPGREADHSPPSSAEVKECVELYLHSPKTPSWRGAQLQKAQGQLYLYFTDLRMILWNVSSLFFRSKLSWDTVRRGGPGCLKTLPVSFRRLSRRIADL